MRHSDGTRISDLAQTRVDPEKMAWLQDVLANYVKDLTSRLQEIKKALEEPENEQTNIQQQEALLDELQEIVEDIDQAKNLHLIGGLFMLMEVLDSPHCSLRWRAAEIVATCVQNNQQVQQVFFEEGVLPKVISVATDEDPTCQLKGWMAVSCLIRNFLPAHHAFLNSGGFGLLLKSLDSESHRLQRRGLFLLEYLLSHREADQITTLAEDGHLEKLIRFMGSEDIDVREKAMGVLLAIAKTAQGQSALTAHPAFQPAMSKEEASLDNEIEEERDSRSAEMQLHRELKEAMTKRQSTSPQNSTPVSAPLLLKP